MSLVVTNITSWVNENNQSLYTEALLGGEIPQLFTRMPNIKGDTTIKTLATNAVFQAGGCGWSADGTTTLSDITISVKSLKVNEALCGEDLDPTSMSLSLSPGFNAGIPFEKQYVDLKLKMINRLIDDDIMGTTSGSTTKISGLIYQLNNDSDVHDYTFTPTSATTEAQWVAAIFGMYNHLSADAKSSDYLRLLMGYDWFALLNQALASGTYKSWVDPNVWVKQFGIRAGITPLRAMDGKNVIILASTDNFIYAYDGESTGKGSMEIWESQDNKETRFWFATKFGVKYYLGDRIVLAQ